MVFSGEVLRGDRIVDTLYDIRMNAEQLCTVMCSSKLKEPDVKNLIKRIQQDYSVHL